MSTPNASRVSAAVAPLGPMLWRQTLAEVLRLWRTPSFIVPTLLLPLVLYTLLAGSAKLRR